MYFLFYQDITVRHQQTVHFIVITSMIFLFILSVISFLFFVLLLLFLRLMLLTILLQPRTYRDRRLLPSSCCKVQSVIRHQHMNEPRRYLLLVRDTHGGLSLSAFQPVSRGTGRKWHYWAQRRTRRMRGLVPSFLSNSSNFLKGKFVIFYISR